MTFEKMYAIAYHAPVAYYLLYRVEFVGQESAWYEDMEILQ